MARSLAFGLVVLERAAGLEEQNESLRARLRAVEARVELGRDPVGHPDRDPG